MADTIVVSFNLSISVTFGKTILLQAFKYRYGLFALKVGRDFVGSLSKPQ
jgi:hypothetical protein